MVPSSSSLLTPYTGSYLFIYSDLTAWFVESKFLDTGLNLGPQQ